MIRTKLEGFAKKNGCIKKSEELIQAIVEIFMPFLEEPDKALSIQLKNLENEPAQKRYVFLLNMRAKGLPFYTLVLQNIKYWNTIVEQNGNTVVYVGKWGDEKNDTHFNNWVDLSKKNEFEIANLSIVRIIDEYNFLDNQIMKFCEVFNDLGVIDANFFKKIKYGTENDVLILLIKNVFSLSLAKKLIESYESFLNIHGGEFSLKRSVLKLMKEDRINPILIFEAQAFCE